MASVLFFAQLSVSSAASVEVEWISPEKFSDINAGEAHKKHFREKTFKSFEEYFAKLAESLPKNQKLVFDVTNIDLAGNVNYGGGKRIRVVKPLYSPKMEFSYRLLDANDMVIKSENVSLKDMRFIENNRFSKDRNGFLAYEKTMLDDWFKETFTE
jgi:hypothetical protein